MNYLTKIKERSFTNKVKKLRKQNKGPIVQNLHREILYEKDAYEVLRYYVNLSAQNPLPDETCNSKSNLLKLACGINKDENHYWLYCQNDLYYAVQIGLRSMIFIGKTTFLPYQELDFAYLKIPIKNCFWQIADHSRLYGYFLYASELEPIALLLNGFDIRDIDESVWGANVHYSAQEYRLDGYDALGRKGEWYDVWLSPYRFKPIYDREEANLWPVNAWKQFWKGEKIIHQFKNDERPSLSDMLMIWKIFLKNV